MSWRASEPGLMQAAAVGRPRCPRCERPFKACLCPWVRPTPNEVEVLVLQDPAEQHQAKGSVRLMHLSLARCQVVVGACFAPDQLTAWLSAGRLPVLLYPAEVGVPALSSDQCLAQAGGPQGLRLVVLDGTWRKSRRLLLSHPQLQSLPRLSLQDLPPSMYGIRKAHAPHQRSTLEAVCHALSALERAPERYADLLAGFAGFVAQQQGLARQAITARAGSR